MVQDIRVCTLIYLPHFPGRPPFELLLFFNFYYHTRNPILRHYLVHPIPLLTLLLARYLIAKCRADAWFGYKEEILHITPNCGDSRATIITFKPKMEWGESGSYRRVLRRRRIPVTIPDSFIVACAHKVYENIHPLLR